MHTVVEAGDKSQVGGTYAQLVGLASFEHMHHGGGQPQGSKLALCTHVVTEAGRGQRLEWEGFRHLVSVNMKT